MAVPLIVWLGACGSEPGTPADGDADGDGFLASEDCDDEAPRVHPGAWDFDNDGIDADCDGDDGVGPLALADLPLRVEVGAIQANPNTEFAICDLDGDGVNDLVGVLSRFGLGPVEMYWAPGPFEQAPPVVLLELGIEGDVVDFACGNREGSEAAELVVATTHRTWVHRLAATLDRESVELQVRAQHVLLLDSDGDGFDELVFASSDSPAPTWVIPGGMALAGSYAPDALPGAALPGATAPRRLVSLGALDGDGAETLAFHVEDEAWLLDDLAAGIPGAAHHWASHRVLAVADLDGDGARDDAFWAGNGSVGIGVDALAAHEITIDRELRVAQVDTTEVFAVGDVDGDGAEDGAFLARWPEQFSLHIFSGAAAAASQAEAIGPIRLLHATQEESWWAPQLADAAAGDLDGDGVDEVLITIGYVDENNLPMTFHGWQSSAW